MRSRAVAVLFALLLVASPISAVVAPSAVVGSASAQTGSPDGFVGLPDTNVQEDLPVGTNASLRAADLEGSVMTSSNASSLEVVVTTPERAEGYVNGSSVGGSASGIALVFQDDQAHAGRDVAVPADAIREATGGIPETVHGVHEDGAGWSSQVDGRNGLLIFHIPRFSSNTVTFDGMAQIEASPAQDESQYTYDVGSPDSVSDFDISVTGSTATEWDNESGTALGDSSTLPLEIGGNADPHGPSTSGEPLVQFTGRETTFSETVGGTGVSNGGSATFTVNGDTSPQNAEIQFTGHSTTNQRTVSENGITPDGHTNTFSVDGNAAPTNDEITVTGASKGQTTYNPTSEFSDYYGVGVFGDNGGNEVRPGEAGFTPNASGSITQITIDYSRTGDFDPNVDVYVSAGGPDSNHREGTLVKSGYSARQSPGEETIEFSEPVDVTAGDTYSVEFVIQNSDGDDLGEEWGIESIYEGHDTYIWKGTKENYATDIDYKIEDKPEATVTLSNGDSVSTGPLSVGESTTMDMDVHTSDTDITIDGNGMGTVDYDLGFTERTATKDPSVDVDGDSEADASYSGYLYDGETATVSLSDLGTGSTTAEFSLGGDQMDWSIDYDRVEYTEDPGVDLDGDGTPEAQYSGLLAPGETATAELAGLSTTTTGVTIQTASSTETDVEILQEERTETVDPNLVINGNNTDGAVGRLSDGETATLPSDSSWIEDGQNNVTVTVGDGSLSADAPTPQVDLNYTHEAAVMVEATYVADGWEESYNVSHTYAGDRKDPTLSVPFSSEIYRIAYVEQSINGGDWTTVPADSWELSNGTDLTVHMDDNDGTAGVEAGDTVAVRTAGYKIQAENGQISVTDPTDPTDNGLDTGFTVDERSPDFRINVGGTANGDRVHYLHTVSWDSPEEEAVLDASGGQSLYMPNAVAGGTARVTTIPLEAELQSGDVGIHVADPDEPALEISPGPGGTGSDVTYRWYDVESGVQYGLYSLAADRYLDKADSGAEYVELTNDDSQEEVVIRQPDGSTSGSSGSSGYSAGGAWESASDDVSLQELAVLASWAALVVLMIAATGRSDLTGRRRWVTVGIVSVGTGLGSLELIRPGTVSGAVNSSLADLLPLAGLAAIGIGGYSIWQWWQTRREEASTPETKVTLDLGGSDD